MLSILIPAYNEGNTISATITEIHAVMRATDIAYEIIVINDGSTDNTVEVLSNLDVQRIHHPTNGGYGRSLKTGLRQSKYEWICIIDADGTYPPTSIPKLLEYIPDFDMVVGARSGKYYWGSLSKRIGRLALLKLVAFVIGINIPDVNSGLRIFRKQIALKHIKRISSGFSFTTTLTLAMFLDEHFVKYVPIDYLSRQGTSSKVKIRIDSLRMLQILAMAIVYYNPLKLFLLICIGTVILGALLAILSSLSGLTEGWILFPLSIFVSFIIGSIGFMIESSRLHQQNQIHYYQMLENDNIKTEDSEI